MTEIQGVLGAAVAYCIGSYLWEKVSLAVCLNTSQAAVDASKCNVAFDAVEAGDEVTEFDLPFIEVSKDVDWWFEIWLWDFIGRQVVMEHAANHMQVHWPDFDAA